MANKKFRRFITGILLSCNIASFSFCSANYDVLTENIANQSGSEKLKALYNIGAKKMQRPYADESERLRIENQSELNEIDEQIKICKNLQKYYQNLFKDCCDPQELKTLRDKLVTSLGQDDVVLDCYTTRAQLNLLKKKRDNVLSTIGEALLARLLLGNPAYHFIYIAEVLKFSNFTPVGFTHRLTACLKCPVGLELSVQTLWNLREKLNDRTMLDLTIARLATKRALDAVKKKTPPEALKHKIDLNTTKKTVATEVENLFFSRDRIPKRQRWETTVAQSLKTVSDQIQNCLKKALQEYQYSYQAYRRLLNLQAMGKSVENIIITPAKSVIYAFHAPLCGTLLNPTTAVNAYITFNSLRTFTNGGNTARGKGEITIIYNTELPKINVLEENEHLSAHFEQRTFIESNCKKKYYGKFNVENSIFFSKNDPMNVGDLLDLPLNGNKTVIISAYKTKHETKGDRNNYVFYIYDYDKYGFVKTGEVYDKDAKKWYPAYAIMFVTNEKNELITVYPLYM